MILLLGIPVAPPSPLPPHFWLRVLAASVFFLASLWIMDRLFSRRSRPGPGPGGGGRRRAVPFDPLLLGLGPAAKSADDATRKPGEPPEVSEGDFVDTRPAWKFNRPTNSITALRGFDARHDSFALSNPILNARRTVVAFSGSIAARTGDAPPSPRTAESCRFLNAGAGDLEPVLTPESRYSGAS
jgi:hypothetical protein